MNSARNIASEVAASKNPSQCSDNIEEMTLTTVTKLGRAGIEGALTELLARLDDADDREEMLWQMLKAASKL